MKSKINSLVLMILSVSLISCAVSYAGLKFSDPGNRNGANEDFVLTKDGQTHKFSGIKQKDLVKKNHFVLSESEKIPIADVIAYRIDGNEYRTIEGFSTHKIVSGRINVYLNSSSYMGSDLKSHGANRYYVQKGDAGEPVMLIPQYAKKEIYNMLSDYQPSKDIMDKYLKSSNDISMGKVVDAINTYNIR